MVDVDRSQPAAAVPTSPPAPSGWRARAAGLRERLAGLWPADERPRATRTAWLLGTLAVLAGAAVSLGRTSGPGPFNSIWAEDGQYYLSEALGFSFWDALVNQANGYFVIVPRLLAWTANLVPIAAAPALMSIEAAIVTGLMALLVYVASGPLLPHPVARLVAAVPVLVSPVGDSLAATGANNIATLQFAGTYTALWALLWVPASRGGRAASVAAVLGTSLSTLLGVFLLPIALLRLFVRRDRFSAVLVGCLGVGAVLDLGLIAFGLAFRPNVARPRSNPFWALRHALDWGVRTSVFGHEGAAKAAGPLGFLGATAVAFVVLLAVVVVAFLRLSRPAWLLAIVLTVHALAYVMITIMLHGRPEDRYLIGPELMLFAALAALLLPRSGPVSWRTRAPIVALAVFVALVCGLNYRLVTARSQSIPWDVMVARGQAFCADPSHPAVYLFPNLNGQVEPAPARKPPPGELPLGFGIWLPCTTLRP